MNTPEDVTWWDDAEPHEKVTELCRQIEDSSRRAMNVHHLRLYGDRDYYGASGVSWGLGGAASDRIQHALGNRRKPKLSVNVIRNMTNAATSMITRSRPRPYFLTSGGDFDLQRKAKKRTQFCDAIMSAENTHQIGARVVQHANILGTGALKIVRDYDAKKIRHELTYIGEILVDETEAVYGCPRNYFQVRAVDRLQLLQLYPDKAEAIEAAKPAKITAASRGSTTDQVIVVEAWHLKSGDGAKDGKRAIVTDGGTLEIEDYPWDSPPFAFFRWEEDPLGFYGTGIPSELCGIQFEINETIRNIQANWWSGGNLKVLVEKGSKVTKAQLSNDLRAAIVEYVGQPPTWLANEAVAPGLMQYLQFLIEQAYNVTGISQLTAQQQTPAAEMSGRARLVQENSESLRFLPAQRRHEQFYIDIARRTMEAAQDIYKECGDFEVIYAEKDYLDPIKYSEIGASDDTYDIQCTPTSILPSQAAGKLEMVERFEARGYIGPNEAKKMLDFPDFKRELDLDLAQDDWIVKTLTDILDGKQYVPPSPEMDQVQAEKRVLQAIALAEHRGVKPNRIEKLREWRASLEALAPPPPPPPPLPMGPPPGPGLPGAPPVFPEQVAMPPAVAIAPDPAALAPQAA